MQTLVEDFVQSLRHERGQCMIEPLLVIALVDTQNDWLPSCRWQMLGEVSDAVHSR